MTEPNWLDIRRLPLQLEAFQWRRTMAAIGPVYWHKHYSDFYVDTLEGCLRVNDGDWIIRGVKGEFYPCKPDVFDRVYEIVSNDPHGYGQIEALVEWNG